MPVGGKDIKTHIKRGQTYREKDNVATTLPSRPKGGTVAFCMTYWPVY